MASEGRVLKETFAELNQLRQAAIVYLDATVHFPGVNCPDSPGGVGAARAALIGVLGDEYDRS